MRVQFTPHTHWKVDGPPTFGIQASGSVLRVSIKIYDAIHKRGANMPGM